MRLKEDNIDKIGCIGEHNELEVFVRIKDSERLPCFHIRDTKTKGRMFHSCVLLQLAVYWNRDSYPNRLNHNQMVELAELMETKQFNKNYSTIYEKTLLSWILNNTEETQYDVCQNKKFRLPNYRNVGVLHDGDSVEMILDSVERKFKTFPVKILHDAEAYFKAKGYLTLEEFLAHL